MVCVHSSKQLNTKTTARLTHRNSSSTHPLIPRIRVPSAHQLPSSPQPHPCNPSLPLAHTRHGRRQRCARRRVHGFARRTGRTRLHRQRVGNRFFRRIHERAAAAEIHSPTIRREKHRAVEIQCVAHVLTSQHGENILQSRNTKKCCVSDE